jgi:hypothetical protein
MTHNQERVAKFETKQDYIRHLMGVEACKRLLGARDPPNLEAFSQGIDLILPNGMTCEVSVVDGGKLPNVAFQPRLGVLVADVGILCRQVDEHTIDVLGWTTRSEFRKFSHKVDPSADDTCGR